MLAIVNQHVRQTRPLAWLAVAILWLAGSAVPVAVAASSFTSACFASHPSIAEAAADFNEDGIMDVALTTTSLTSTGVPILGYDVEVYLGMGDGSFQPPVILNGSSSLGIAALIAVDANNDGHMDIVTSHANGNNGTVSVFAGLGNGSFASMKNYGAAAGSGVPGVAAGDFNGDGRMDLVAADGGDPSVAVLIGTGNGGSFKSRVLYPAAFPTAGITTADVNNDGRLDIIAVNQPGGSPSLSVLLGKGDGTFHPYSLVSLPRIPGRRVFAADLDHDGNQDLVLGTQGSGDSGVLTLLGHGDGTFAPATYVATSTNGSLTSTTLDVAVGDLNGDGRPDVVAANVRRDANNIPTARDVAILLAQPDGSLVVDGAVTVPFARGLDIADFNGDGLPDVASDACILLQGAPPGHSLMLAQGASSSGERAGSRLSISLAPNPWRETGSVSFTLSQEGHVFLDLFDLSGRRVASLLHGELMSAGEHSLSVVNQRTNMGAGVYFCRLWTERGVATTRVVLTAN